MLIVEGPDCVGKTTFCDRVYALAIEIGVGLSRRHFGPEMAGSRPWKYLNAYLPYSIADRYHVSEHVYDRATRDGDAPLANGFLLERTSTALRAIGAVTVLILPTRQLYDWMLETRHDRGEMFSIQQCRKVRDEFASSAPLYRAHHVILDDDHRFFDDQDAKRVLDDYLHVQAMMEKGL